MSGWEYNEFDGDMMTLGILKNIFQPLIKHINV